MAKLTSSYPHTTNNFQPQNLFFSVKIIVKQHTQRAIQSSKPEKAGKRMGREKMLTSLERRLPPWLGNTKCMVASREKKISGLVLYQLHTK